jgi:hypothetical protein
MPRAAKPFFIPVVHSPPRAVGHVAAPELPSQEGTARAVGHVAAPELPSQEGRALGHVVASELTLTRRQGPGPQDTWQRRSSPQQGGEVQS